MTTADYIVNLLLVFAVLRQARERRVDLRSVLVPLVLVALAAHQYLRVIPSAGNDVLLIVSLASLGTALGLASGFLTHIRRAEGGVVFSRVGWIAGVLLVGGISARMAFAFAVTHGAQDSVRTFSIENHIGPAAWPAALVLMALCEVTVRIATVQLRAHRINTARGSIVCAG